MGRIYAKATCVVFSTGPEKDSSREALDLLQHIGRQVEFRWYNDTMSPSKKCSASDEHFSDPSVIPPYRNGELTPVLDLFSQPYFRRLWIRQEVAFAKRANLHCGPTEIKWQEFRNAIACLTMKSKWFSCVSSGRISEFGNLLILLLRICQPSGGTCLYEDLRRVLSKSP